MDPTVAVSRPYHSCIDALDLELATEASRPVQMSMTLLGIDTCHNRARKSLVDDPPPDNRDQYSLSPVFL